MAEKILRPMLTYSDEAHRLNEKSGMFHNMGENQIKEMIHAAKCSVFFIDESQRVTLQDIGSVDEIRKWAEKEADEIIKNTYRTLMTRGMKGCYVYCTNQRLSAYLKKCLGMQKARMKDDKGND